MLRFPCLVNFCNSGITWSDLESTRPSSRCFPLRYYKLGNVAELDGKPTMLIYYVFLPMGARGKSEGIFID